MKTHTHAILTAALLLTTAVYGETLPERQQQSPQRNTSQSTTPQPSPARPSPQSAHTPQGEYGSVTGLVECRSDSTTYVLGQVNVKGVFGGRDTLYTYTLNNGIFTFERALPGKATITVSHIGYKSVSKSFTVEAGKRASLIFPLREDLTGIEAVKVETRVPFYTTKGDTVVYNAAAVSTLADDRAIDILKQMPGVSISDNKVTVFGEEIVRSYVNDKQLFADGAVKALSTLMAGDVLNIEVYDEVALSERLKGRTDSSKKERVMNIKTRKPMSAVIDAYLAASIGRDLNETAYGDPKWRYAANGSFGFYSERLNSDTRFTANNINFTSLQNLDNMSPDGGSSLRNFTNISTNNSIFFGERWKETSISMNYEYKNDYQRELSGNETEYFASEDYLSRSSNDSSESVNYLSSHEFGLFGDVKTGAAGTIQASIYLTLDNSRSHQSYLSEETISTAEGDNRITDDNFTRDSRRNYSIRPRLTYSPLAQRNTLISPYINASFDYSHNDGSTLRREDLSSSPDKLELRSSPLGYSRNFTAEAGASMNVSGAKRRTSVYALYSVNYRYDKTRQYTYNYFPDPDKPLIDTANTRNFTYDYWTHRASLIVNNSSHMMRGLSIYAGLDFTVSSPVKRESFPELRSFGSEFYAILPRVRITLTPKKDRTRTYMLDYSTSAAAPSIEQLTPRIDNSNQLSLTAGNPDLKQSYTHNLSLAVPLFGNNEKTRRAGRSMVFMASAVLTQNPIASRSHFFAEATTLPQYDDFVAPQFSTLYTYENIDMLNTNVSASLSFMTNIRKINTRISTSAIYNYFRSGSYLGEQLNVNSTNMAKVSLSVYTTLFKQLKLSISTADSYNDSHNTLNRDNCYMLLTCNAVIAYRHPKHFYALVSYGGQFYRFITDTGRNLDNHGLNAEAGVRLFKRRLDLKVGVYDILNRQTGFQSVMTPEYMRNSWNPTFGRYWLVTAAFVFNGSKE